MLGVRKQPKASKPFQLDFSEGDVSAASVEHPWRFRRCSVPLTRLLSASAPPSASVPPPASTPPVPGEPSERGACLRQGGAHLPPRRRRLPRGSLHGLRSLLCMCAAAALPPARPLPTLPPPPPPPPPVKLLLLCDELMTVPLPPSSLPISPPSSDRVATLRATRRPARGRWLGHVQRHARAPRQPEHRTQRAGIHI